LAEKKDLSYFADYMGKIAAVKTDDGKEVAQQNISQHHFLK
jgi:hypothetical protein